MATDGITEGLKHSDMSMNPHQITKSKLIMRYEHLIASILSDQLDSEKIKKYEKMFRDLKNKTITDE